jgi:hypothetical protein
VTRKVWVQVARLRVHLVFKNCFCRKPECQCPGQVQQERQGPWSEPCQASLSGSLRHDAHTNCGSRRAQSPGPVSESQPHARPGAGPGPGPPSRRGSHAAAAAAGLRSLRVARILPPGRRLRPLRSLALVSMCQKLPKFGISSSLRSWRACG